MTECNQLGRFSLLFLLVGVDLPGAFVSVGAPQDLRGMRRAYGACRGLSSAPCGDTAMLILAISMAVA